MSDTDVIREALEFQRIPGVSLKEDALAALARLEADYDRHNCFHDAPLLEIPGDQGHFICADCGKSFFTKERWHCTSEVLDTASLTPPASDSAPTPHGETPDG